MSQIETVIQSREKDLGDGFKVRRSLPHASKQMVGPFIFWDHMGPVELKTGKEVVVRAHPHIGLATLTFLFSGSFLHRDSLQNEILIQPGEVNWMTAGSGITHSERSQSTGPLEGIQLWVALPKEAEDTSPQFQHFSKKDIPVVSIGSHRLTLIAGKYGEYESPVSTYSPLFYLNTHLNKNSELRLPLQPDEEAAVYIASGAIQIEDTSYEKGALVCLKKGADLHLQTEEDSNLMILGGQPFPEKRYIWWNFVSSDSSKIEEAKKKWKKGGFAPTIHETEEIPLPE